MRTSIQSGELFGAGGGAEGYRFSFEFFDLCLSRGLKLANSGGGGAVDTSNSRAIKSITQNRANFGRCDGRDSDGSCICIKEQRKGYQGKNLELHDWANSRERIANAQL